MTAIGIIKYLKQTKEQGLLVTSASISDVPSNISTLLIHSLMIRDVLFTINSSNQMIFFPLMISLPTIVRKSLAYMVKPAYGRRFAIFSKAIFVK